MARGRNIVLLDLFALLPRLAATDRKHLIQFPCVVEVMAGGTDHDLIEWDALSPMQRAELVELLFIRVLQVGLPVSIRFVEPGKHILEILF